MRMGVVLRRAHSSLKRFARADRGNIAMIFGLALIPLCLAVGVGLDMSRAMITRARLGAALDAAGLAVGSQPNLTQDQMQSLAREYFKQNYTADLEQYGHPEEVTLTRPEGSQTITLRTSVQMPTVLMRIVGVDTMDVAASSQITWGQTKLWVALVLDNTGSMCQTPTQPTISSCPTPASTSKIVALQAATHNLLQMLENAASNDGDVKVSIVPFSKDVNVGTSFVNASWIDWTNWEAPPPNSMPDNTVGPGSACPYGTSKSPYGYNCTAGPQNGSKTVSVIPSTPTAWSSSKSYSTGEQVTYGGNTYIAIKSGSNHTPSSSSSYWQKQPANYTGYICPSSDNGNYNDGNGSTELDANGHYYNGCYNSTVASSSTSTVNHSPTTVCSSKSSCTTANYCTGYPSTTTSVSGNVTTSTTTTCECHSVGNGKNTCTRTATDTVTTTYYNHTWIPNDHSTWSGCIMDRAQDYDTTNDAPSGSAKFPAENSEYCLPGTITPLGYDWSTLSSQVDAMTANGNTNQTVGLAWGWMTLTNSDPFNPGELPEDTRKVLILLTDGLNTQNRWSGNQSTIDDRTEEICQNIKDDNIIVYTVQVNTGGDPQSSVLYNCASDPSKFFMLTAANQIVSTFQQIGTQITNLRVSL